MNAGTKNQPDIFEIGGDMARERTTQKSPDLSAHPCMLSGHHRYEPKLQTSSKVEHPNGYRPLTRFTVANPIKM